MKGARERREEGETLKGRMCSRGQNSEKERLTRKRKRINIFHSLTIKNRTQDSAIESMVKKLMKKQYVLLLLYTKIPFLST